MSKSVIILLLFVLFAVNARAQPVGTMSVHVEIVAPKLTLTVSSSRLNFGQVASNAGEIILHPDSGGREGNASGEYSTGGMLLTGTPGSSYTVTVFSPNQLSGGNGTSPLYSLRWANAARCEQSGFSTIASATSTSGLIGKDGCARLQIGGLLTVDGVTPGRYSGTMTIYITNI